MERDYSTLKLWFVDFWHSSTKEAIMSENPIYKLLSKRWEIQLDAGRPDFIICSCYGCEYLKWTQPRIYYTGENFRPPYRFIDYSFSFDWPITERNYRLPYYRLNEYYEEIKKDRIVPPDYEEREFCSFLVSNPRAKERIRMLDQLSTYKKVDSGGKVRNNIGRHIGNALEDKLDWMKEYKFALVFENSSFPGYTTEKLIEALLCGTIPIYWGNPLVSEDFNTEAFINVHDFPDFASVVEQVQKVDQDPELAKRYLTAAGLPGGKEADYLSETAILDRFEKVFNMAMPVIPEWKKRLQLVHYPIKMSRRYFETAKYFFHRLPQRISRKINRLLDSGSGNSVS